jgi:hypothetical protein
MAGLVQLPFVFGTATSPVSSGNLDNDFNALAAAVNSLNTYDQFYSDVGVVNALQVNTLAGQSVVLTSPVLLQVQVKFTTTTGSPTLQVNGLGVYPLVGPTGVAPLAGSITAGMVIEVLFDPVALVWRIISNTLASVSAQGSFLTNGSGFVSGPTGTVVWSQVGPLVMLALPALVGTSNFNAFNITNLPPGLQPPTLSQNVCLAGGINNSAPAVLVLGISNSATPIVNIQGSSGAFSSSGFATSGQKGFAACTVAYFLL